MAANIKTLNQNGDIVYPQTLVNAISDGVGNTLQSMLDAKIDDASIVQTTGASTTEVMSQKATTDNLNTKVSWGGNTNGAKKTIGAIDNQDLGIITNNTEKVTVTKDGKVGIGTTNPSALLSQKSTPALQSAILGAELTDATNWTLTTGWAGNYATGFTHTAGAGVTPLTRAMTILNATLYQISWTVSGRTTGSFTVSLGGQISAAYTNTNAFGPKALTTGNLIITPTSDFNGTISNISVNVITGVYGATFDLQDSTGVSSFEIRNSLNSLNNTFIGKDSGRRNTTGSNNIGLGANSLTTNTTGYNSVGVGYAALYSNTTGYNSVGIGYYALYSNTTGYNSVGIGISALYSNTTGYNSVGIGIYALYSNTTGYNSVGVGYAALYSNTTGNNLVGIGYYAGRYLADGSTGRINGDNGIYLGSNTKASANGTDNETVIGANAIGAGSNSVVLGSDAVTKTLLKGNIGIGTASPTALLDINSDKLRLRTKKTPSSSGDTGNTGDICWDDNYMYVCINTNTWKRTALETW